MTTPAGDMNTQPYAAALVPHYGPNNNQYYSNYYSGFGVPEAQTPEHTAQQQQQQQRHEQHNRPVDFLESELSRVPPSEISITTKATAEETRITRTPSPSNKENDIPAEIVASQERALAEIKKRYMKRQDHPTTNHQERAIVPHSPPELVVPPPKAVPGSRTGKALTDAIHPMKYTMKKERKRRTAGATVGGAIVGGVILGPAGMLFGGAAAGVATNKFCKAGERREQRKWEQNNFQHEAERSKAARSGAVLV